jgi:hypothetical protein
VLRLMLEMREFYIVAFCSAGFMNRLNGMAFSSTDLNTQYPSYGILVVILFMLTFSGVVLWPIRLIELLGWWQQNSVEDITQEKSKRERQR